jgi:hypothetical protein
MARGDAGQRQHWEGVARQEKLGLKVQWGWFVDICNALTATLERAFAPLAGKTPQEIPALLPPYRLDIPLTVYRTAHGVAAYIERSDNPNTAAWLAGSWVDGVESWGPKDGGVSKGRFREQGDDATIGREGTTLHYQSSHFGATDIELPPGPAFEVTLGAGGATPLPPPVEPPPTHVPPPPPPPQTSGRSAAAIAADILSLGVSQKKQKDRARLAEEVRQIPTGREPAQIAADLGHLGISQGQQDLLHQLQKEVAGLGGG